MPLFEWGATDLAELLTVSSFLHGQGPAASARVEREILHRGLRGDDEAEGQLARTRWLEANGAERSFPCGVVPQPEPPPGAPRLNVLPALRQEPVQVIAAVLPTEVAFILEEDSEEVTEVGRLPRSAIREVDVVDEARVHVPEPLEETFEPPALSLLICDGRTRARTTRTGSRSAPHGSRGKQHVGSGPRDAADTPLPDRPAGAGCDAIGTCHESANDRTKREGGAPLGAPPSRWFWLLPGPTGSSSTLRCRSGPC